MITNSSQLVTPDKCNLSDHLQPGLYDEASKTENGTETSQPPHVAAIFFRVQHVAAIFRDIYHDLEYVISTARAIWDTRGQHSQGPTTLLAGSTTDDNIHMYLPMQKRLKTQLNQSEHIPLSTPAVPKEKTLAQVEMKIAGAEKTDMFRNEGIPTRKTKTQKEKRTKGNQRG